ncbi:MAG: hypothetical protein MZW92_75380 [Comamonadaceae bacterium]|nr:hypothetical protein [Comamonadaceae bacterium]
MSLINRFFRLGNSYFFGFWFNFCNFNRIFFFIYSLLVLNGWLFKRFNRISLSDVSLFRWFNRRNSGFCNSFCLSLSNRRGFFGVASVLLALVGCLISAFSSFLGRISGAFIEINAGLSDKTLVSSF